MKEKCALCSDELKKTFLDKLDGTRIKIGKEENSKIYFICSNCQKENKNNLKEKLPRI